MFSDSQKHEWVFFFFWVDKQGYNVLLLYWRLSLKPPKNVELDRRNEGDMENMIQWKVKTEETSLRGLKRNRRGIKSTEKANTKWTLYLDFEFTCMWFSLFVCFDLVFFFKRKNIKYGRNRWGRIWKEFREEKEYDD